MASTIEDLATLATVANGWGGTPAGPERPQAA